LITNGNKPSPRSYHKAVVIGKTIFVFGGQKTFTKYPKWYNDVHTFDTETCTWEKIQTHGTAPPPAAGSLLLYKGSNLVLFGGGYWEQEFPKENIKYYNDTYMLNIETRVWTKLDVAGMPPDPRGGHGAIIIGKNMLITGGYFTDGSAWPTFGDAFVFDLETKVWKQLLHLPHKMGNHVMIVDDGKLYLHGGIDYEGNVLIPTIYSAIIKPQM